MNDGKCEVWYDIGNRYRPSQVVRCRKRAVEVVDGTATCAAHAPRLRKIAAGNHQALEELKRVIPDVLEKAQADIRQLREEAAVDRSLLDLPMTI